VQITGDGVDITGTWGGYNGEYQEIVFGTPALLKTGRTYNLTITTGQQPQIHHTNMLSTGDGTIAATSYVVGGETHYDWIPAIKLYDGLAPGPWCRSRLMTPYRRPKTSR